MDSTDFAKQIYDYFINFDIEIFFDINNIVFGKEWRKTIESNIAECDLFIIILTQGALRSLEVENEVLLAKRRHKIIIPCRYSSITNDEIKWGLAEIQGISFENQFDLVRRLHSIVIVQKPDFSSSGIKSIPGMSRPIPSNERLRSYFNKHKYLTGVVSRFQVSTTGTHLVWSFALECKDDFDKYIDTIQIELSGKHMTGFIADGDRIRCFGKWKEGQEFKPDVILNMTLDIYMGKR